MKNLKQGMSSFLNDESGQDLIEYALVSAVIALGAVTAMGTFAKTLGDGLTTVGTKFTANV